MSSPNRISVSNPTQPVISVTDEGGVLITVNYQNSAGGGDVVGPSSSTDNAIARYDGTTGKLIQDSSITIADGASGTLSGTNSGDVTLGTANGLSLAGQALSLAAASGSTTGALTSADWTTFNAKQSALTLGNLTSPTTGVSVTGGTGAVVGSGAAVTIQTASGSQPGLLSAADWTTFNSKQAAGSYITALTGDVTASGPGSVTATLANTSVTPGSYTLASITVDAKGRVTAASNGTAISPGGSNTQVQFNNSGAFGGDADFTFDTATNKVGLTNIQAIGSGGINLYASTGTSIGNLGPAGTANVTWDGSHNFSVATQDTLAAFTGVGKTLGSLATTTYPSLTEISYVKGVTSAIQTQLNGKQATLTLGTGVATALAVNVGSAGALVTNGGALGTPSSGTLTSCTGLPISTGVSGLGANVATSLANAMSASGTLAILGANTFTALQQFSGTDHAGLRLNNLTTAQRDALASPAAGMVIWNTTAARLQLHNGSAWTAGMVRLDGDTMTGTLTVTPAANTSGLVVSGYSLTGSSTTALLNLSGTWNTTGIAEGLFLNITNTASNAASRLLRLQASGVDRFAVAPTGGVTLRHSASANDFISIGGTSNMIMTAQSNAVGIHYQIVGDDGGGAPSFRLTSGGTIEWNSTTTLTTGSRDLFIRRGAAGLLSQHNSTNAQAFRVANTFTSATNFEAFTVDWQTTSNVCRVGTIKGSGGGTARALSLITDATVRAVFEATTYNTTLLAAAGSYGSGSGVLFLGNATTAPTTDPTGGGILYVEAGALKYRGSSGTVTTIANA